MEKHIYPIRSFIRFQAKQQLIAEAHSASTAALPPYPNVAAPQPPESELNTPDPPDRGNKNAAVDSKHSSSKQPGLPWFDTASIDNDLLKEIATTLFNSDQYPELYRPCKDIIEATAIEDAIALEIVLTYQRIKQNEQLVNVQALNKLL